MRRLFNVDSVLTLLLVFVPIALVLDFVVRASGLVVFVVSAIAIIPLAGWMGRATEHLASHVGAGLGGLLNATFGNAAELIIAIMALRAGLYDLVKASITGSIIGNLLLVFGLAALAGGLRRGRQTFNKTAAAMGTTMLLLGAIALIIPATFHVVAGETAAQNELRMSLLIALILLVTYVLSLLFTLKTHSHLYVGSSEPHDDSAGGQIRKMISPMPFHPEYGGPVKDLWQSGDLELEVVPQGVLAERLRAGGAGIGGVFLPTGVGTRFSEGKETRQFDGKVHILEFALKADFALLRAQAADTLGNMVYEGTGRNWNHTMAMSAAVTVAEVDQVHEVGGINPELVITQAIFIDRLVLAA